MYEFADDPGYPVDASRDPQPRPAPGNSSTQAEELTYLSRCPPDPEDRGAPREMWWSWDEPVD